jgi:hypothetical protein
MIFNIHKCKFAESICVMSKAINLPIDARDEVIEKQTYRIWPFILLTVAFIACFLLSITPIARAGQLGLIVKPLSLPAQIKPFSVPFLTIFGAWLPSDLHLASDHSASLYLTADLELLVLLACAFLIYALVAVWLLRRTHTRYFKLFRALLWIAALVAGILFVVAPGMSSNDLYVYADYGNMLWRHGANPYFASPYQVAPHDILTMIDSGWSHAPSAYGPVWIVVTMLFSLLFGTHPLAYMYGYRLLGCICNLINIWLIGRTLRIAGRSERIVLLGMLLYAWNPLALFENALGAHNDVFMSTLILCGVYLSVRAEQRGFTRLRNYLPALIALTLAVLVKFTSLPLIIFFLVLLGCHTLRELNETARIRQWRTAITKVVIAGIIFVVLALLFYLPFWIGHSVGEIMHSFSAPPSSINSENSLMRIAVGWWKDTNGGATTSDPLLTKLASILRDRSHWNQLDALAMVIAVLVGAWSIWRRPDTSSFIQASLATLAIILLVTPWFYPWYVVWLIALMPLLLIASPLKRAGRALLAFSLSFSVTAFSIYLDFAFIPFPGFELVIRYLLMIIPPLVITAIISLPHRKYVRGEEGELP